MSGNALSPSLAPPSSPFSSGLTFKEYLFECLSNAISHRRFPEAARWIEQDPSQLIPPHLDTGVLDWDEIARDVQEIRQFFHMEPDTYTDDFIDDDEADFVAGGEKKGAPPAAKSAIESLETFEVKVDSSSSFSDEVCCVVCTDAMVKGEIGKKLPCGHCYHGHCIVQWLGIRNSCPLCRFQLKTDDAEYEEE